MTEQEYIITGDRVKVSQAKSILSDIVADINPAIDNIGLQLMVRTLSLWEDELFKMIKVEKE